MGDVKCCDCSGSGFLMTRVCGRCAGHGTIQGIRFDMESSPVESYKEPCPQCAGSGRNVAGVVAEFASHGGYIIDATNPYNREQYLEQGIWLLYRIPDDIAESFAE